MHATSDGVVVVMHDETVDRTTDGTGLVRGMPLATLRDLDAGARFTAADGTRPYRDRGVRVPTLDALLDAFPDVPLNIEVKQQDPAIEPLVLATLDRHGARDRTLLAAEHHAIMLRIRAAAPDVVTSASAAEAAEFVFHLRDGTVGEWQPQFVALQVPASYNDVAIVTPESVAAAHARGVEMHVWTVNDEPEMDRLLDLGVDALMSDFPARVAAVLRRRGLRA